MDSQTNTEQKQNKTQTNTKNQSYYDVLGAHMPARIQYFVVVETIGKDGMVVRHILSDGKYADTNPSVRGLFPRDPLANTSIVDHVINDAHSSQRVSATTKFPKGIENWPENRVYIDLERARKAGVRVWTTEEIAAELNAYKQAHPKAAPRIDAALKNLREVEAEVLLEPPRGGNIPPRSIFTPEAYTLVQRARVIQVVGILLTAYHLGAASNESVAQQSIRPIAKESLQQAGGWAAAWAGYKIGFAAGALIGVETGPGCIITGFIGGAICGYYGYKAGQDVGNWVFE